MMRRIRFCQPTLTLRPRLPYQITLSTPNLAELLAMAHAADLVAQVSTPLASAAAEPAKPTALSLEARAAAYAAIHAPPLEAQIDAVFSVIGAATEHARADASHLRTLATLLGPPLDRAASALGSPARPASIVLTLGRWGCIVAEKSPRDNQQQPALASESSTPSLRLDELNRAWSSVDGPLALDPTGAAGEAVASTTLRWVPAASLEAEAHGALGHGQCAALNVTGAGDTLAGAALWRLCELRAAGAVATSDLSSAVAFGTIAAAAAVLELSSAVPPALSRPGAAAYLRQRAASHPSIKILASK